MPDQPFPEDDAITSPEQVDVDRPGPTTEHTSEVPRDPEDPDKVVTAADQGVAGGEVNLGVDPAQTADGSPELGSADAGRAE